MGDLNIKKNEVVVFGGGCFWCTEAIFKMLTGVVSVLPGYAGGLTILTTGGINSKPSYEEVCSGNTGHAEVIRIEYNNQEVSFRDLLTVFFATHDPTTLNHQGADTGTQYRSVIFYTSELQREQAEVFIKEINASYDQGNKVVTEIKPLDMFYPAEEYHQDYYQKNQNQPYCQVVINPKLEKVQEKFAKLLKENTK